MPSNAWCFRQNMNWDDFKYFSTVARCGSVRAAARELHVHPSTVTRRIEHFERRLGARLFARTGRGLSLTTLGSAAVRDLHSVEQRLARIERSIKQEDQALAGTARVALPEFLLLGGLLDDFIRFVDIFPRIAVEWLATGAGQALTRGAADLGIDVNSNPPLDVVGRRIGSFAISVYGSEPVRQGIAQGQAVRWIEWLGDDDLAAACAAARAAAWPDAAAAGACHTVTQVLATVKAGVGVAALPCLVGDREPALQRLPGAPLESVELWLLTAPELRYARRIKVLGEHLVEAVEMRRDLLNGQVGAATPRVGDR